MMSDPFESWFRWKRLTPPCVSTRQRPRLLREPEKNLLAERISVVRRVELSKFDTFSPVKDLLAPFYTPE
jgi:hypothetical protein